ncbi:MAG: methyltransferase domain-containing protein [Sedimentisphaerales bacterium]|nr:methyltransferase domain-containing protein [Sedimentisphaerales bacterium]
MSDRKIKSAREIAVEVLNRCDPKRRNAGPVLDRLLGETDQRQKATDLIFGTLRNRGAIDTVIAEFSGRPVERIQDKLLSIIRIGVYELIYCPATEEYAIVNEAVECAKTNAGVKQAGFVNAVLRQIIRHIDHRRKPLSQADVRRTLIQTASYGCEFDMDFLPDIKTSLTEYLSVVFSLPQWLVSNWLDEFGEESVRQICLASNRKPSITLRPNRLKTTAVALAEKLRQADIEAEISSDESMIKIKSPRAISELPGFAEGEFIVQDITASQPVRLLNPQKGWTILDLCAAPGVKTTQLAEATKDSAEITATDINPRRLEKIKENIARLGLKSIDVVDYKKFPDASFDSVVLDVPCSNTGVLAKRIEARYRINPEDIQSLTKIQNDLLEAAVASVKPHGKICYSTCSIQRTENNELIQSFLKRNPIFELECEELILPSAEDFDHDGGYTAVLSRK